jgi:SAM-dependent methyltransferase
MSPGSAHEKAGDPPTDYHDYVFRDGRLIGDFEGMYRFSSTVPWHQDKTWRDWPAQTAIALLASYGPFGRALEVGCGLGYFAAAFRELVRDGVDAFDVSPEAIDQARQLHAGIGFYVDDIRSTSFVAHHQYDLVVVRDVLWYVFPFLEVVIRNLCGSLRPGGYLLVAQSFPALDRPFVGADVIPNPAALIAGLNWSDPIHSAELRNHRHPAEGPMLIYFGQVPD